VVAVKYMFILEHGMANTADDYPHIYGHALFSKIICFIRIQDYSSALQLQVVHTNL